MRIGSGYIGSDKVVTSSSNEEVIPPPPSNWSEKYKLYKFSFYNEEDVTVKVNGGNPIFLRAGQGFVSSKEDMPIRSFITLTPTRYNWIGAY